MGLQVFQEYNPLVDEFYGETGDPRTANERRLYRYRTWGSDAAVFVIDARSFRDESLEAPTVTTTEAVNTYLAQTFDPIRTMIGQQQYDDLKADLLRAHEAGITWKFIMIPEPAQNLGPVGSDDRYEGYAAERTALLRFIVENGIQNVVFIAADIHGTIINNMTYQEAAGGEHLPTGMFEISTGSVAFDAPFGPTIVSLAAQLGLLAEEQAATFRNFPRPTKELLLAQFINAQIAPFGYDPIGLDDSDIDAELLDGGYMATNTFGWTEFEIDAETQVLTVTTYGIDPYTQTELDADPAAILARVPQIVSQFAVTPK
jgi:3-phytase/alkaline phosphatase D